MKYKLIALDVDGTLLNDDHQLSEQTKRTIRKVNEAGCGIVLCTGRGPASTWPILEELGLQGIMITHNGALTVRSEDSEVLHQYPIGQAQLQPLVSYCRERGIHFDLCTPFHLYVESLEDGMLETYRKFFVEPQLTSDITRVSESAVKFTVSGETTMLDRVEQEWRETGIYHPFRMIRSGDRFIDIISPEATKGNALKQLAAAWSISREQIVAIGNYFNDVEMIEYAGLGIAMGNSPEGVKQAADAVTGSNNEDGVHSALTRYVLSS
jgi:Cof subfamily protein (haloacid dehalogenase superfamily)